MAISSPWATEILVTRILAPMAREDGYTITPEMEQEAIRRIRSGEVGRLFSDPKSPEDAEPGEWQCA